jgi:hypothetical protein
MLCFDDPVHACCRDRVASPAMVNPFLHASNYIRDLQGVHPHSQNSEAGLRSERLRRMSAIGHG